MLYAVSLHPVFCTLLHMLYFMKSMVWYNYISFMDQNSISHNLPHENIFCQQQVSVNILLLEF